VSFVQPTKKRVKYFKFQVKCRRLKFHGKKKYQMIKIVYLYVFDTMAD